MKKLRKAHQLLFYQNQAIEKSGERGRNRTFNLLIKSQLLCQLSYAPLLWKHEKEGHHRKQYQCNTANVRRNRVEGCLQYGWRLHKLELDHGQILIKPQSQETPSD
jgi:hypothetical protein